MNKFFFLTVSVILLTSAIADCQWYQRRYGVNDINQLNQQQLTESFLRARGGARAGALVSGVGAIGIVTGIILVNHESPYSGDIVPNVMGIMILAGTIPMEITGLTILGVSGTRLQSIRAVMNKTQVSLGIMNSNTEFNGHIPGISMVPCVSVKFNF
jgi:hypothetical protein